MGTLTGNTPSLPEHCDHKLPTSCRLTAAPDCCACQDKRPHLSHYSVYVDGIGLVNRGTRWQRYCYFCSEFWSNRVAATEPRMEASQTRIPDIPNQKPFTSAWFDFHRGYRMEKDENGEEHKIDLTLEKPWRDSDPGTLPVMDEGERRMALQTVQAAQRQTIGHVSLDSTLEELLNEDEEGQDTDGAAASRVLAHRYREAHERAMLDALNSLHEADRRASLASLRKQRATSELDAAERELRELQNRRRRALREYQGSQALYQMLQRREELRQRSPQRFARAFGTREDIERQGSEYVSPLTSMFTRAYDRYRVAEEVRTEERNSTGNSQRHQHFLANLAQSQYPALFQAIHNEVERENPLLPPSRTLDDEQDDRPSPKTEEELTVKLTCKVCLQQIADTACLPCGHLVMCIHCADIVLPTRPSDHTTPIRRTGCPVCRKPVTRRVRIFTS